MAIPGAGFVTGLGNAFNGAARSAQLSDAISQISGQQPNLSFGAAVAGALGFGTNDSDYGTNAMAHNLDPDQAQMALDNYAATGNVNQSAPTSSMPGAGIAGIAGPAASGTNADVSVNGPSAAAFGGSFSGPTSMAQGNDGVTGITGEPSTGFGGMATGDQAAANSNSEGAQGGSGSQGGGGGSSGGNGSSGGGGGQGGDAGGWKDGGLIDARHDFSRASGFVHEQPEGIVSGEGGPRSDAVHARVQVGGFVLPASFVSKFGGGDAAAGASKLVSLLPSADHDPDGGETIGVKLSPGEFYINPAHVAAMGGGDASNGVARLHAFMKAHA